MKCVDVHSVQYGVSYYITPSTCQVYIYKGCLESKERLCIQPAQLFHCTRSVMWVVQYSVDSYLVQLVQQTFSRCECNGL